RIGAHDTRAATPSGLDGPGMSTSAYDLSLIFHYAMKQPEFAKAVATKNFEIPATGGKPAIPVYNDNKLPGVYPRFLGSKFGVTGWIITLVVFLVIVGAFVVGHQRKKALS